MNFFRHFWLPVTTETTLGAHQTISYHMLKTVWWYLKSVARNLVLRFGLSKKKLPNWNLKIPKVQKFRSRKVKTNQYRNNISSKIIDYKTIAGLADDFLRCPFKSAEIYKILTCETSDTKVTFF